MKQCWSSSEFAQFWSLSGDERQLSDQHTQASRYTYHMSKMIHAMFRAKDASKSTLSSCYALLQ